MSIQELTKLNTSLATEFPNEYRNRILKLAFSTYLPTTQDRSKSIDNFSRDTGIAREDIYEVLGIYIILLKTFLQSSDNEFQERLVELGFSSDFIENLPFIGNREEIILNLQKNYSKDFGKLSSLKWRIDISLSQSVLAKRIPNFLVFSMTLTNGKKYIIEMDPRMFHKLRFNIALILNELDSLKSNK
ncbi:uncharacterized protein LOC130904252 [Diorhabda carinulata]|uniref:uncharacterized protein LOC130904252 n=1 Tax=Diorhabda carinulata TaxID=1163345 RepID=UPI0025A1FFF2|nr:uncharacterized protein LOC130904252 [Diorhabda carinulata]